MAKHHSKKRRRTPQAKNRSSDAQKIKQLRKENRQLRRLLRKAQKNHKPHLPIRARLLRIKRRIAHMERPERAARPSRPIKGRRIRRPKYTRIVKGGTRKAPEIHIRRKRRARKRKPLYRTRPKFVERPFIKNYPDATGEFIRLSAPLSYADWINKLRGLKHDPKIKELIKKGYKLTYKIGDNIDGTHSSIELLLIHFEHRYVIPNSDYPKGRIKGMNQKKRDQFFEILTIYAVKHFKKGKSPRNRRVNRTGRST